MGSGVMCEGPNAETKEPEDLQGSGKTVSFHDSADEPATPRVDSPRQMKARSKASIQRETTVVRKSRLAVNRIFELAWNLLVVIWIVQLLSGSAYTPQHNQAASSFIRQSRIWLSGDDEASAWGNMVNRASIVDTLNSTVLDAIHRTHITHTVYHLHCATQYRRVLEGMAGVHGTGGAVASKVGRERAGVEVEAVAGDGDKEVAWQYPEGPDLVHQGRCSDIPHVVPHRGGLWMFAVSRNPAKNQPGCAIQHDLIKEPDIDAPWSQDYHVTGVLGSYKLPTECASSANFEIMDRIDEPDRANGNALAEWVRRSWQWDTKALVILTQLYWEPMAKYDTFGTLLIEQDLSGFVHVSHYHKARHYGGNKAGVTGFWARLTTFLLILLFAWWFGGSMRTQQCRARRVLFATGFVLPFVKCYTGRLVDKLTSGLLGLPLLAWLVTCLSISTMRWAHDQLGSGQRRQTATVKAWFQRYGPDVCKSVVILGMVALHAVIVEWVGAPFVSLALWLFYLATRTFVAVLGVVRGDRKVKLAWHVVDALLMGCAIWMIVSYWQFVRQSRTITHQWQLSSETSAFIAARSTDLELPFSFVCFLAVVRMLSFMEVFPVMAVPWATFVRCFYELVAYSGVFIILFLAFALMFHLNLGGTDPSYSGIGRSLLQMIPCVFGGTGESFMSDSPAKQTMLLLLNFLFDFTCVFFVMNILLALVLVHYGEAREASRGVWLDENLLKTMQEKIHELRRVAPPKARGALDFLEDKICQELEKKPKKSTFM